MTNIAIAGAAGRMGRALIQALEHYPQLKLVGGLVEPGDPFNGTDLGLLANGVAAKVVATDQFGAINPAPQVLVDFTAPEATLVNLRHCAEIGCACVIGTTGFTPEQLAEIDRISEQVPVMLAANYSLGVALCLRLLKESARVLGAESDIEIVEAHHRHKKDAPSGTALRMGEVVAETLGRNLDEVAVYGREGVGEPRDRETIGFATVRAGDIVGEHTVIFAADGERVEISHKASSRMTFARGAMRAAGWLIGQPAGRYDIEDLLTDSD